MNFIKKIFVFILDLLIILFISLWIYMLYIEFINLPRNTEMFKFSIFQIKLTLFTLFLISSIAFLWWTGIKNEKTEKIDLSQVGKEIESLKKIIPELKNEKEIKINESKLEIEKITEAKNNEELFKNLFNLLQKHLLSERISIEFYDFRKEKLFIYQKTDFPLIENIEDNNKISNFVFKNEKRLYVTNIETHPIVGRKNKDHYTKKSFIILPIKIVDKTFGVINISEKRTIDGIFSIEDFEKASFIINIFSQKLENTILYFSLEDLINKKAW